MSSWWIPKKQQAATSYQRSSTFYNTPQWGNYKSQSNYTEKKIDPVKTYKPEITCMAPPSTNQHLLNDNSPFSTQKMFEQNNKNNHRAKTDDDIGKHSISQGGWNHDRTEYKGDPKDDRILEDSLSYDAHFDNYLKDAQTASDYSTTTHKYGGGYQTYQNNYNPYKTVNVKKLTTKELESPSFYIPYYSTQNIPIKFRSDNSHELECDMKGQIALIEYPRASQYGYNNHSGYGFIKVCGRERIFVFPFKCIIQNACGTDDLKKGDCVIFDIIYYTNDETIALNVRRDPGTEISRINKRMDSLYSWRRKRRLNRKQQEAFSVEIMQLASEKDGFVQML